MATLPSFTSHTPARAADVQLIIDALVNQFDLTDTIQTNVGRFAVPAGSGNTPASPVPGQMWFDTSLDSAGVLLMRNNAGQNVPYRPYRQRVESAELTSTVTINSTSFSDVTGLSVNITPSGGRLRVSLRTAKTEAALVGIGVVANGSAGSPPVAYVRAVVGSQALGDMIFGGGSNNTTVYGTPSSFVWEGYVPASGSPLTVKIQAEVAASSNVQFIGAAGGGIALVVEELG